MRKPFLLLVVPLVALTLACSCRGCLEKDGSRSVLYLVPPDASWVVLVPHLGDLFVGVEGFLEHATRKAGGQVITRTRESFAKQFGFDLLAAEDYADIGIDATGSALIYAENGAPEPIVALALKKRRAFDAKLRQIIEKTDGANRFTEHRQHGFDVVSASRPFGDELAPAFHWAFVDDHVLVVREAGRASLEQTLARLELSGKRPAAKEPTSLDKDPAYLDLSDKVTGGQVKIFVRGLDATSVRDDSTAAQKTGALTSLTIGAKGFSSSSFLAVTMPGLDKALAGEAPRSLASRIESGAALALVSRAARSQGWQALRSHSQVRAWLDRASHRFAQATGLDVEREVLPSLAGPLTLAVHITDLSDLLQRLKQRRTLSALLESFHVALTAELSDPQALLAALDRSHAKLKKRGLHLRKRTQTFGTTPATIFEPDLPTPRLGWAVTGKYYVYGAGPGHLARTLEALSRDQPGLLADLEGSVASELASRAGTTVLVLRVAEIARAGRTITIGGQGPALGLGVLLGTALQILDAIGDVGVALSAEPGGLRLRIEERLQ